MTELFIDTKLMVNVEIRFIMLIPFYNTGFGQEEEKEEEEVATDNPKVRDPRLNIELIANGIESPTGMAFLGSDDILVLEQAKGTVQRIVNGSMLEDPILDVNVNAEDERGLLGIAVSKNSSTEQTYVFLFYTEAEGTED